MEMFCGENASFCVALKKAVCPAGKQNLSVYMMFWKQWGDNLDGLIWTLTQAHHQNNTRKWTCPAPLNSNDEYRYLPLDPNIDNPNSWLNPSPVEITCRSLMPLSSTEIHLLFSRIKREVPVKIFSKWKTQGPAVVCNPHQSSITPLNCHSKNPCS